MYTALHLIEAPSIARANLPEHARTVGIDVQHIVRERFSIEDARQLQRDASTLSVGAGARVFVVEAQSFTLESQNALLKLFEEVPETISLYIVVPHQSVLIPTVLSRFVTKTQGEAEAAELVDSFTSSSYAERLALIQSKAKAKEYAWMDRLIVEVARDKASMQNPIAKRSVALVESYISNPGASRKMLLEELALTLPVKK